MAAADAVAVRWRMSASLAHALIPHPWSPNLTTSPPRHLTTSQPHHLTRVSPGVINGMGRAVVIKAEQDPEVDIDPMGERDTVAVSY